MPRRARGIKWLVEQLENERKRYDLGSVELLPREKKKFKEMYDLMSGDYTQLNDTARSKRIKAGRRLEDILSLDVDVFFLSTQVTTFTTLCDAEPHFIDHIRRWWANAVHPTSLSNVAKAVWNEFSITRTAPDPDINSKSEETGTGISSNMARYC